MTPHEARSVLLPGLMELRRRAALLHDVALSMEESLLDYAQRVAGSGVEYDRLERRALVVFDGWLESQRRIAVAERALGLGRWR